VLGRVECAPTVLVAILLPSRLRPRISALQLLQAINEAMVLVSIVLKLVRRYTPVGRDVLTAVFDAVGKLSGQCPFQRIPFLMALIGLPLQRSIYRIGVADAPGVDVIHPYTLVAQEFLRNATLHVDEFTIDPVLSRALHRSLYSAGIQESDIAETAGPLRDRINLHNCLRDLPEVLKVACEFLFVATLGQPTYEYP